MTYNQWVRQAEESEEYPTFINKDIRSAKKDILIEDMSITLDDCQEMITKLRAITVEDDKRIVKFVADIAKLKEEKEIIRVQNVNMAKSIAESSLNYKKRVCLTPAQKAKLILDAGANNYSKLTRAKQLAMEKQFTKIKLPIVSRQTYYKLFEVLR